jgi:hypothetical protein
MNLFVCHSQAHLILAVGLAKGRFLNEKNDLILFIDFSISEEMIIIINDVFDRTLLREGMYPEINKSWKSKMISYPKDLKVLGKFIKGSYSKVFIVCDGNIQEMYILKIVSRYNNSVEIIWLEDGSYPYYVNTLKVDGLNSNEFTRYFRKFFFKRLICLGKFYDFEGDYMSSNKNITTAYLTIKGQERSIFKNKRIISITEEEYKTGINNLFNDSGIILNKNSIILVIDKIDSYNCEKKIVSVLSELIYYANERGKKIYFKYHPREESFINAFDGIEELNRKVAIEYYYNASLARNITIIGVKSTGLQSALSLGFNTISLINLTDEFDMAIVNFFSRIGVATPSNFEIMVSLISKERI